MAISIAEQEVHITFSRGDEIAKVYVTDSTWITKMDKRVAASDGLIKEIEVLKDRSGQTLGKRYEMPVRLLSIRTKIREVSEEERERASERLRLAREQKKEKGEQE